MGLIKVKNQTQKTQDSQKTAKVKQVGQNETKGTTDNAQKGGSGEGDNKQRSRSRPRYRTVRWWPEGVSYHSKNGNKLSKECEKHFSGHCFKCGHSSHTSEVCQIYPEKTTILTLCSVCRSGFHDVCWRCKKIRRKRND